MKESKHPILKKILVAITIVVVILIVLFIAKEVAVRFFGYKPPALSESMVKKAKEVDVVLDTNQPYTHIVTDKNIYFIYVDKVYIADASGSQKAEYEITTSNPMTEAKGKYVVIGDVGGKNLYLFKNEKLLKRIKANGSIIDVSVNASGMISAVTEGDMHKRDVTVYSENGKEEFVWTSGSLFVLGANVADNNKNIVISTFDTANGNIKTTLSFYNMSSKKPIATEEYENELIAGIDIENGYVFCVGDTKTVVYRVSGEKCAEIPYHGKTLITFETDKDKIAFAFSESELTGKRYQVSTYDVAGACIGTHELEHKISYIDFKDADIAVSRGRLINIIDVYGREKELVDPGVDFIDMCFLGTTSKAVGFTANNAYIFSTQ